MIFSHSVATPFSGQNARLLARITFLVLLMMICSHAFADGLQLSEQNDAIAQQGNSLLNRIGSYLLFFGLSTVTICVMIQGYKMMFKKHQWNDVGHIFLGALFIGGAGTIAGIAFKIIG